MSESVKSRITAGDISVLVDQKSVDRVAFVHSIVDVRDKSKEDCHTIHLYGDGDNTWITREDMKIDYKLYRFEFINI